MNEDDKVKWNAVIKKQSSSKYIWNNVSFEPKNNFVYGVVLEVIFSGPFFAFFSR